MDLKLKEAFATVLKAFASEAVDEPLKVVETAKETDKVERVTLKAIDEDKRLFTAVVLRPNVIDSQGDIYDEEVVEKACHNYNEFCGEGNIQHLVQTTLAVPVESWIAKSNMDLGAGDVLEGDWVMTMRIDDNEIWDMCKKGDFTGFSVGCISLSEDLNNTKEEIE